MRNVFERHRKVALSFSGGKDSLACLELFSHDLDRITLYHMDTGDLLPEIAESAARIEQQVPHFVRIQGDVLGWQRQFGLPTDLLPYSQHPVGRLMGQTSVRLVPRYDCCFANLMFPVFARIRDDGNTLLIRGTKRVDMPRLPVSDGDVDPDTGIEMHYPLLEWTHAQVFDYLDARGIQIPRIYAYRESAPECARCSAWWHEGRNEYLRAFYPGLWRDYQANLTVVRNEIDQSMHYLEREMEVPSGRLQQLHASA